MLQIDDRSNTTATFFEPDNEHYGIRGAYSPELSGHVVDDSTTMMQKQQMMKNSRLFNPAHAPPRGRHIFPWKDGTKALRGADLPLVLSAVAALLICFR